LADGDSGIVCMLRYDETLTDLDQAGPIPLFRAGLKMLSRERDVDYTAMVNAFSPESQRSPSLGSQHFSALLFVRAGER